MKKWLSDLLKWSLIVILAGIVYYILTPRYQFIPLTEQRSGPLGTKTDTRYIGIGDRNSGTVTYIDLKSPRLVDLGPAIPVNRQGVTEYAYVASIQREVFHKPDCRWAKKISPSNLIGFKSRDEATKSGRRPCKVCRP